MLNNATICHCKLNTLNSMAIIKGAIKASNKPWSGNKLTNRLKLCGRTSRVLKPKPKRAIAINPKILNNAKAPINHTVS